MPTVPPETALRRVLSISAIDGWSVALIAGACTVISLLVGSGIGVIVGLLVTTAGAVELHGHRRLVQGNVCGVGALVAAQVIILVTIVVYAVTNLLRYDEAALLAQLTPRHHDLLARAGLSFADLRPMLKPFYAALYSTVMGVTVLFQGGLALFYHSRKPQIAAALRAWKDGPPPLP